MSFSITELTILGIVWSKGPCTTYVVMRELAASPSSFYRNRAATAYRSVQRLVTEGLLENVGDTIGSRRDRPIRITDKGYSELRSWLTPPLPDIEVAHTVDLVRLRLFFVGAIDRSERGNLVDDAIDLLRRHLVAVEAVVRQEVETDPIASLASLGSVYETKARIEWLEAIRAKLLEI